MNQVMNLDEGDRKENECLLQRKRFEQNQFIFILHEVYINLQDYSNSVRTFCEDSLILLFLKVRNK